MTPPDQARIEWWRSSSPAFSEDPRHVRRITMVADYDHAGTLPPLPTA